MYAAVRRLTLPPHAARKFALREAEMLHERADRYLTDMPGYLVVDAASPNGAEVADIFRSFAVHCLQKQINRVLVRTGVSDLEGEHALRDAFTTIRLAGVPPGFRIALVSQSPMLHSRYRNAQRDLSLAGVAAKLFESEAEAERWLAAPHAGTAG